MNSSLPSNYLDAFFACAQTGNFTKAAAKLNITQSALSQRIQNLESELETGLLIRDRSGIRLTEAGEVLLRYCQTKQSLEAETLKNIFSPQDGLSGSIRLGGFSSVLRSALLPTLAPLITAHPNLQVHFMSREMDELPGLIRTGEIDFMVMHHEHHKDDLCTHVLGQEKNVLVEKRGYRGPDIFLDHDENDEITIRYLKMTRRKGKIQRRFLDDVYGLLDGVRLGLGRAVVPLHLVRGDKDFKIVNDKELAVPLVLHYYKQPFYSALHKAVVEQLIKHVKDHL